MDNGENDETALVPVSRAAKIAGVTTRTMNRWVREGRVSHKQDASGHRVIDARTLPLENAPSAFDVIPPECERVAQDEQSVRETHEVETTTTTRNPMAEVLHEAVEALRVANDHSRRSISLALEEMKREREEARIELARVREENTGLHTRVRELLVVQEELLDRAAERGLLIQEVGDDLERKRANRDMAREVFASWVQKKIQTGAVKREDEAIAKQFLDRFFVKGEHEGDAESASSTSGTQSTGRQTDPQDARSDEAEPSASP